MSGLTIMQARAMDAIRAGTIGGVSPSYREIALRLGLAGPSGVHRLVKGLVARGKIRRTPTASRSLEIVGEEVFVPLKIERLRAMPLEFLTEEIGHAAGVLFSTYDSQTSAVPSTDFITEYLCELRPGCLGSVSINPRHRTIFRYFFSSAFASSI